MRGKLWWHQVVVISSLVVLTVWRVLVGGWAFDLPILWWWLGAIVGFMFVFFDRFFYIFATDTQGVMRTRFRELFGRGRIIEALTIALDERKEERNLVMRSLLFYLTWIFLAVLTMTSVADMFSRGIVLGIGLHLVFDLAWDYFVTKSVEHWFWGVKIKMSQQEVTIFILLILFVGGFLVTKL